MPLSEHDGSTPIPPTTSESGKVFLIFYSSIDESGRMWCPDCRDVETHVKETFQNSAEDGRIIYVGQRAEWKTPANAYRASHDVQSVPTIVRYKDGTEDGRLVDSAILVPGKLEQLIRG